MFVIHEGRVEVLRPGTRVEPPMAVLEKGDFFGEMALLEGLPRSASVRALTDVKVVRIDGATFSRLLSSQPEIAVRIMRRQSRRLREADRKIEALLGQTRGVEIEEIETTDVGNQQSLEGKLVHEPSGTEFTLPSQPAARIGRRDPITGIQPEIDLSAIDADRSCSRQHAKIVREGDQYLLIEDLGTTNGTFLNGKGLKTGIAMEIRDGDALRFGSVALVFHV